MKTNILSILAFLSLSLISDTTQIPPNRGMSNSLLMEIKYINTVPPPLPDPEIIPTIGRVSKDLFVLRVLTNHVLIVTNKPDVNKMKGGWQISFD